MTILIFANGELELGPWIKPYFDQASIVIAADGGLRHLKALGQAPNLLIGDLDSAEKSHVNLFKKSGLRQMLFDEDKDETDLELALLYAAQNYPDKIVVFGAVGGRLDHQLANMMLLTLPELIDRDISCVDRGIRIWIIQGKSTIDGEPGDLLSLIPLKGAVHIASTSGLRWPLRDEGLEIGRTRGMSNIITDFKAEIVLKSGLLLCIHITEGNASNGARSSLDKKNEDDIKLEDE